VTLVSSDGINTFINVEHVIQLFPLQYLYIFKKGAVLLCRKQSFWRPDHYCCFIQNPVAREDCQLPIQIDNTALIEGIKDIEVLSRLFRLTPSTQFLAIDLLKLYSTKHPNGDLILEARIILFLASKMRERDSHFRCMGEYLDNNGIIII